MLKHARQPKRRGGGKRAPPSFRQLIFFFTRHELECIEPVRVYLLVTTVNPTKTDEPIKMSLTGLWTRVGQGTMC